MARRHQKGRRPKPATKYRGDKPRSARADRDAPPAAPPRPAGTPAVKPRRGGVGGPPPTDPFSRRVTFDTSRVVPLFRTEMNPYQADAWRLMGERRITLLLGPAGTAKTHCAMARAMHELIVTASVGRVFLARPAVEAGEKLGFMPGDANQKLDPYFRPCHDILGDLVGWHGTLREQVQECMEIVPVAFMRGRTFKDAFVVVDEAQNCTWAQLKMAMTRLGKGSRMVVTGDPDQSDLPHKGRNPLARLVDNIRRKGIAGRAAIDFQVFPEAAIVRDDAVVEVLEAFDDGLGDDDWPADDRRPRRRVTS